jgi:hypothetical protein
MSDPNVQPIRSLPQQLAGFIYDHLKWLQGKWGSKWVYDVTLNAHLADLGLPPMSPPPPPPPEQPPSPDLMQGHMDSIARYRDAADPDVEALRSVLDDIFAVVDSASSVFAAIDDDSDDVKKELAAALLNLLLLNYLRLKYNGWYKTGQLIAFLTGPVWDKTGPTIKRFGESLRNDPLICDLGNPLPNRGIRILETEEEAKLWSDIIFTLVAGSLAGFANIRNIIYGWDGLDTTPTPIADRLSRRTLTISFEHIKTEGTGESEGTGENVSESITALNLTMLLVPRSDGGPGIFVSLSGAEEIDAPINKKWRLKLKSSTSGTLDFLIPFSGDANAAIGGSADASVTLRIQSETDERIQSETDDGIPSETNDGIQSETNEAQQSYVIPDKRGTRLEFGNLSFTGEINAQGAGFKASAEGCALVIVSKSKNCDGFVTEILPTQETRIDFELGLGISSDKGFYIEGGTGLQAVIPVHRSLGPLRIQQLLLKVSTTTEPKPGKLGLEVSATFDVKLGPVTASIDQLGFQMVLPFAKTNGKYDFDMGLKPPNGVGLSIEATGVTGGGFLFYDSEKEQYGGVVQLNLEGGIAVKGVGLIATRLPDNVKGFSLLIIISVEDFKPIQLGLGFTLTGIGGLLAINRTFDENMLRAGLKNHTLDSILFPKDPLRNAPQILSNLNNVFPPAKGHHLFGPMLQIAWGTPPLITANLAVVLELGARQRLLVLAQIVAILPNPQNDLLHLQMDAVGVIDFDQSTAALDATLHDSRLLGFVLTGDMAMRLKWKGSPNFALAIGGFHPAFNPPPNFPKLERIALNLAAGDNPRIRCEAYFALTSNTVQFGARAELYAKASGFSIQGEIGFDVLIQFDPFHFLADFYAQVQLKRGSRNLFKVRVEGALDGPRPLHIKGKATFEILWWDYSVRFDTTLVEGELPPLPEPIDIMPQLKAALGNSGSWTGQLPEGQRPMVTLRTNPGTPNEVLLHPLSTLTVKQSVVPLNLDISKFGQAAPTGARRFTIRSISPSGLDQTASPVTDFFAPAQFFEMSDDDKLSRPSFESMAAGVSIGSNQVAFTDNADDWLEVNAIEFETTIVDTENNASRLVAPYQLPPGLLAKQALFGAAANCDLRRTGQAKYRTTIGKYRLAKEGWSIVATDDLSVATDKPTSYSEAAQSLRKLKQENPAKAASLKILRLSELL